MALNTKETLALNAVATAFKLQELDALMHDVARMARLIVLAELEEKEIITLKVAMNLQAATLAERLRDQLATLAAYQHG